MIEIILIVLLVIGVIIWICLAVLYKLGKFVFGRPIRKLDHVQDIIKKLHLAGGPRQAAHCSISQRRGSDNPTTSDDADHQLIPNRPIDPEFKKLLDFNRKQGT